MIQAHSRPDDVAKRSTSWTSIFAIPPQGIHSAAIRIATIVAVVYSVLLVPGFAEYGNLQSVLYGVAAVGIAAVGMATITINGRLFMLSLGATASLASVIFSSTLQLGLLPALILTTGFGAVAGALQGCLVAFAGANPIITTIAVSSIITGVGVLWTGGHTIFGSGDASWLASGQMLSIPNQIIVLLVFTALVSFVFAKCRIGREIYLIGMNPNVAEFAGLRAELATCLVYTIAGFSAALSGALISSSAAQGNMTYGIDLDFNAIAAVLVGGISIRGGRGRVVDALVGALFLTVIGNLLLISGARYETQFLVKGAVVLGSVVLGTMLLRLSPRFLVKNGRQ